MTLWTWACRYLFITVFSFPSTRYPEVELLDHMVVLFLIFWGTSRLFSLVASSIYNPILLSEQGFPLLYILCQHLLSLVFFMIAVLTGMKWHLTVVVIGFFLMSDVQHLLKVLHGHLSVFFGKMSIQVVCQFSNQIFMTFAIVIVRVVWVSYIFCMLIPYQIHDLQILSSIPWEWGNLRFVVFYFAGQKCLAWWSSTCWFCFFCWRFWCHIQKNHCQD